jgi:hypothetical protein
MSTSDYWRGYGFYSYNLGSASVPVYSNMTSTNSGIYYPTSTSVGVSISGSLISTVNSSGLGIFTTPSYPLHISDAGSSQYGLYLTGTTTSASSVNGGMMNNVNFNPTASVNFCIGQQLGNYFVAPSTYTISNACGIYIYNTYTGNLGTISAAYGIYCDAGSAGASTITNAYGGYYKNPTAGGTSNCALYTDNISVGYAVITPPTNGAIISGNVGIGTSAVPKGATGVSKLAINGTDANVAGPHLQFTTSLDNYPLIQFLPWAHGNVNIQFDSYFDGSVWRYGSTSNTPFSIQKASSSFNIAYAAAGTAGNTLSWTTGFTMNSSGYIGINATSPNNYLCVGTNGIASGSGSIYASGDICTSADSTSIMFNTYYNGSWHVNGAGYGTVVKQAGSQGLLFLVNGSTSSVAANGTFSSITALTIAPKGNIGINTNSPDAASLQNIIMGTNWNTGLYINGSSSYASSNIYGMYISQTGTVSSSSYNVYGAFVAPTLGATTGNITGIYINPNANSQTCVAYGMFIEAGSNYGNVSTAVGLQVQAPTAGSGRITCIFGGTGTGSTSLYVDSTGQLYPGSPHFTYANCGTSGNAWNSVWSFAFSNASDATLKENIDVTPLGLNFINKLKPVTYKWKDTVTSKDNHISEEDSDGNLTHKTITEEVVIKHKRLHHGFLAQDIKILLEDLGLTTNDFGGYVDPMVNEPDKSATLGLNYIQFISPIVKAIQELSGMVNDVSSVIGIGGGKGGNLQEQVSKNTIDVTGLLKNVGEQGGIVTALQSKMIELSKSNDNQNDIVNEMQKTINDQTITINTLLSECDKLKLDVGNCIEENNSLQVMLLSQSNEIANLQEHVQALLTKVGI